MEDMGLSKKIRHKGCDVEKEQDLLREIFIVYHVEIETHSKFNFSVLIKEVTVIFFCLIHSTSIYSFCFSLHYYTLNCLMFYLIQHLSFVYLYAFRCKNAIFFSVLLIHSTSIYYSVLLCITIHYILSYV